MTALPAFGHSAGVYSIYPGSPGRDFMVFVLRRFRESVTLLLLLLASLWPSAAKAGLPPHPQYTRSLWGVEDGLPEATVQALLETQDGYLWVGTTGGLTRFDGTHFATSNLLSAPAVNSIFCLTAAPDGTLWIGTEGGGLLHLQKNSVRTYTTQDGLTDGFVRSILRDRHGTIWLGTDGGLFEVDGNRVRRFEAPGGTAPLAVHGIAEDSAGRIWVGGSRLFSISNGHVQTYPLPGSYSSNRVKTILQTVDGTIWVGTVGGLDRLVNGRFERVSPINSTVRALRQTSDGTLWIGTIGGGLWTFKNGSFRHSTGLLPSSTVLVILEDKDHQVWIGLQDGLVRLSQTPVGVVPLPGGFDSDFGTISGDSGGRIWAVASRVYLIEAEVAHPHVFSRLPGSVKVRNVFRDREGDLWIGTDGSGAYRITPQSTVHYSAPRELTNNFIRGFLETRRGDIWVATDEGVNRISAEGIQQKTVKQLGMKQGLVYFSTRSLLEDHSGDIWIGTDQGLSHWRHDHFVQDGATEALRREKVWSIFEDTQGTLWFGTRDHGLFCYRNGSVAHITTKEGLLSNSIYQILEDPGRRFWISGPSFISSLPADQLQQWARGAIPHLTPSTYALPYGAEDTQMYGGRQPSGYVDPDGVVWFPSSKGALHVLLTRHSIAPPPRLVIDKVTLDGRELPLSSTLHLPSDMTRLEFQFAALSLRSQSGLRFRYKLENFDKGWIYAGTNLTASYTNLPSGNYRFVVNVFDVGDPSVVSQAGLDLRKDPVLWERWWFLTLCLSTLCLGFWITHKARMHQVKLRFKAVLDERSRLAREMHDTVIQGCTSVSALLEAIASTQTRDDRPQDELLRYARAQVRTTIHEARQTVWNLRHEEDAHLDLVASLQAIALQTNKESAILVECVSSEEPLLVAAPVARELLMVVREAVYNAVRHGFAQRITISATFQPERLLITVLDDGIGFNLGDTPTDGHYGITGMRERMQRVGGSLRITSATAQGTQIELSLDRPLLNPGLEGEMLANLVSADSNADLRRRKPWSRR